MAKDAVAAFLGAKFDLVGPTVDDDVRRVIARYGAEAVKHAVREVTRPKRGRRAERDWPELQEIIEADARDWLDGGDPLATRSNYSIAKSYAERNPGHSSISTHKRIERKLAKRPFDRRWFMLHSAEDQSRHGPYLLHLRALEALAELTEESGGSAWNATALTTANSIIAEYEAKLGEPPPPELSLKDVEEAAQKTLLSRSKPTGLGALLAQYVGIETR
jgi:hypothetical protein